MIKTLVPVHGNIGEHSNTNNREESVLSNLLCILRGSSV